MRYNIKGAATFILVMVLTLLSFSQPVKAQMNLTDAEYEKLHLLFTPGRIASLTDEEIEYYLSIDEEDIITAHKYYKTIETENGTICTEVSELEALTGANTMMNLPGTVGTLSTFYQTAYKRISISYMHLHDNYYKIFLGTEWLVTPNVKSFDVTGIRVYDATITDGLQFGTQAAWNPTDGFSYVHYSPNGTNIVKQNNGFGISMNLINSGVEFYADIETYVTATSQYAKVYGSYQHAVYNVTLIDSKSYTISGAGLGYVFNFATAVEDLYDGMGGVDISLPYSS